MRYLIVKCPYCKNYLTMPEGVRTRTCPYCGKKLKASGLIIMARAKDGREAALLVRMLKAREAGIAEVIYGKGKHKHSKGGAESQSNITLY
ncbi:MAG: DUF1922 domain-containing protein [Thermoprotei archaeon]|nr:DUF1922 domain-containing protein [Thermoprotei archaeon]